LLLTRTAEQIVVVVDDDPHVREALGSLLNSAQLRPMGFSSAEDVLQSGVLARASCLVSDMRMPGIQGLELQRLAKQKYPALPVILITAHQEETVENGSPFEGAAHLFYKPLDPEAFLNAILAAIADSTETR
jgi:FixJ family two-component response regulator